MAARVPHVGRVALAAVAALLGLTARAGEARAAPRGRWTELRVAVDPVAGHDWRFWGAQLAPAFTALVRVLRAPPPASSPRPAP